MYFDIGANIGRWALSNIGTCNKIISIEASPITYTKLIENCKDTRIILLNYAVCDNDYNDIIFYHADADTISTLNKDWLTSQTSRFYNHCNYTSIVCKTTTIDRLIELYGIPELIKIDVEGGEYECLKSLTQKVNSLCFEWASEVNDITFKCLDYAHTLGFNKFYVQFEDSYTFRPNVEDYIDINKAKTILMNTQPKIHWGMMWCM